METRCTSAHGELAYAGAACRPASDDRRLDFAARGADYARARPSGRRGRRVYRKPLSLLAGAPRLDRSPSSERLIEIGDDVLGVLEPDREPNYLGTGPRPRPLLVGELAM